MYYNVTDYNNNYKMYETKENLFLIVTIYLILSIIYLTLKGHLKIRLPVTVLLSINEHDNI